MKKIFAEFIAAFIPGKRAKNRWRGILRYGALRAFALRFRKYQTPPKHYLAICAIAKNEGEYFAEWIKWHAARGVEKFYIYDNESTDNTKRILKPYIKSGLVEYKFWPGKKQQLLAYEDCLESHRTESRWIAFIDLDEFIVPAREKTITKFLKPLESFSVVEINWVVYGSGGATKKTRGLVMNRFKHHSKWDHKENSTIKSIVDPRRTLCFIGAHEAVRLSGRPASANGQDAGKHFWRKAPVAQDIIRVNHYAVKSYEEFLAKRARGRARSVEKRRLDYFKKFDLNDLKD